MRSGTASAAGCCTGSGASSGAGSVVPPVAGAAAVGVIAADIGAAVVSVIGVVVENPRFGGDAAGVLREDPPPLGEEPPRGELAARGDEGDAASMAFKASGMKLGGSPAGTPSHMGSP